MFPISENRIQKIITKGKRLIDSHNVVFFDVFDTLITRDCSKPTDVFELVEHTYNKTVKDSPLCNFCRMRQEAEKRSAKTVTAPNLDEIYDHLSLDAFQKIKLKDIEIDIERKLSVKKYTGYALYQYAKQQGKQIVAVSDMYLGSGIIREMLSAAGYSIDNVIVSCDYRAEKYNGNLFQIALNNVSVSKQAIIHFGDNLISDILGAKRAGIDCLWIPARKYLSYFKKCGDSYADNFLYPFIANRVPLIDNRITALGYETCGPMIVGFCQWLHQKLHEGHYNKALFCARDMLQTYQIYLQMYPEDYDLTCYFYASRKSIQPAYEAAIEKDTSSESFQQLYYLRDYINQLGCRGKVAFIDSGLNGRSQKMLMAIMHDKIELHGLYMRIAKVFFNNVQDRETYAYMYPAKPNIKHMISSMFFETMIAAVHGRTTSYVKNQDFGKVEPILGNSHPSHLKILAYHKGVELFARDYNQSCFSKIIIDEKAARDVMLRLAFFPQQEDVKLLEDLKCGNEKYEPLIIQKKPSHYLLHVFDIFRDLKNTYWKGGFLCNCFSCFSPLVSKVYLLADCFILDLIGEWSNPREPE